MIPEPISIAPQTIVLYEDDWVYRPAEIEICEAAKLNGKFIKTTKRFTDAPQDEGSDGAIISMTKGNWLITIIMGVVGIIFCNKVADDKKEAEFAEM